MVNCIKPLKLIVRTFQIKPVCDTACKYSKLSHNFVHDTQTCITANGNSVTKLNSGISGAESIQVGCT